eukprot:TRINITY_DN244_c0_g1_i1.p1 TRINITY_DN244_c0_g1~~TRINITY_DN244_c0_g1_i1.p1  ORF type:complete len:165 (-),score=42.60 TRINITY_DN244_c0_g1_i1:109-603(-)
MSTKKTIYDFTVKDAHGQEVQLSQFKGKVLLIVNVASQCGFTPQYKGLQALYTEFKDQDFVIIGFPCNQFGSQEPGSNEEILEFCSLNFGVNFPIMDKIDVNGNNAHPVYEYLKNEQTGILGTTSIKWNFTKFLINKEGIPIKRYGSNETPEQIRKDVAELLGK